MSEAGQQTITAAAARATDGTRLTASAQIRTTSVDGYRYLTFIVVPVGRPVHL